MELNFWERVENLLDNKDVSRKELAAFAGFDVSNIGKGIANNNVPSAETAVKIAQFLGTTVEYLVTGQSTADSKAKNEELDTLYKYSGLIHKLDVIPKNYRSSIEVMISDMSVKALMEKEKED